jgi:acetyl-CoA carboxylase carboxyltransferase component
MAADPGKSMEQLVEALRSRREHLQQGGGADRLARQKEEGKLTARERIEALADPGSFEEIGLFSQHRQTHFGMAGREVPADGVVTGAAAGTAASSTSPARTSPSWAARRARSTVTRSPT